MSTWYPIVLKNWNIRNPSSPILFRASSSGCSTYRIGCPSFFDSAAGRSPKANSSPASSTVLPSAAFGSSNARATNSPMSFTATSCWRVLEGRGTSMIPRWKDDVIQGLVIVHESDGSYDRVRDPRGPHVLFHLRLRLEMRNTGVPVGRGDAR